MRKPVRTVLRDFNLKTRTFRDSSPESNHVHAGAAGRCRAGAARQASILCPHRFLLPACPSLCPLLGVPSTNWRFFVRRACRTHMAYSHSSVISTPSAFSTPSPYAGSTFRQLQMCRCLTALGASPSARAVFSNSTCCCSGAHQMEEQARLREVVVVIGAKVPVVGGTVQSQRADPRTRVAAPIHRSGWARTRECFRSCRRPASPRRGGSCGTGTGQR